MKKPFKTILGLALLTSITLYSCKKEETIEEETTTQTDARDIFVGNYNMNWNMTNPNSGQNNDFTGVLSISKQGTTEILLTNVGGYVNLIATVSGNNIFISAQDPENTTGSGSISGNNINLTVSPHEGTLTGNGTKQ